MAFWGAEVKAGRPVTHKFEKARGRLHISQAALGLGTASTKSVVQCNIGNKSPVILCALLPDKTESCHLDLEFEEADDVIFSVIGPRSVHLTGYYPVSRHLNHNVSSESYGVDIANSDSVHSVHGSDECNYEDSFINDDEPGVHSESPISSDTADEMSIKKKPRERKESRKRLKKRYKSVVSEDESNSQMLNHNVNSVPESDDEDCALILTLIRSETAKAEEKLEKDTSRTSDKKIENEESHHHNRGNNIHDKKIEGIGNKPESNKKAKAKRKKTPKGVLLLQNNNEDCAPISTLLESKTTQTEGNLLEEKTGDKSIEIDASHLQTRDNSIHDEKADDLDKVAVNGAKSKKKRKKRTQETPESISEIQNIEDVKTLHMEGKGEEKEKATDREEQQPYGGLLLLGSITTQPEEKLENETSKTGDKKIENGGSHLETRDYSVHDKKTDDLDNGSKSKKKKKERAKETPEANCEIQNIVMKDEKNLQLTEEKGQATDRNIPIVVALPSTKSDKENDVRPKKRRKKSNGENLVHQATMDSVPEQEKVNRNDGEAQDRCNDISIENKDQKLPHDKNHILALNRSVDEKGKKKKKNTTQGKGENGVTGANQLSESEKEKGIGGSSDKNVEAKLSKPRTLSNGLIIEEIDMGKPDGKVATSGKRIKVHYVGKLRDGGHTFDSNIGKSPLKFRLGDEGVTEGWNIGLDGMHVGGKRRLTIPPTNGDGSQGAGENVPPNSWLVYEFELVGVR